MAHDVFISHSIKDKTIADAICAKLERERVRCWIAPRDVLPGADWGEAIIDAIRGGKVMVLVISASANQSPQIKREVERAVNKGVIIIPFRIEDVPLSKTLEYYISASHWLDAITPPLEQHLSRLAETIKVLLERIDAPATDELSRQKPHERQSPSNPTEPTQINAATLGEPDLVSSAARTTLADKVKSRPYLVIGVALVVALVLISGIWMYLRTTPSDIAKRYGNSVVYLESNWKLANAVTGAPVFHMYIPNAWTTKEGNRVFIVPDGRPEVAVYTKSSDGTIEPRIRPLFSGSDHPIAGQLTGSGFVVSIDGFILTTTAIAAPWDAPYSFSSRASPGVLVSVTDGKSSLEQSDGHPILCQAPTGWIPSQGTHIPGDPEVRFRGQSDRLDVAFAGSDSRMPAKLVRASNNHSLVLIKVDLPEPVKKIEFNDNFDTIRQGDTAMVLAYPMANVSASSINNSLVNTIPTPTISVGNIARVIRGSTDSAGELISVFGDVYQLSVNSTSPSNRGAPVFDERGRVIGVFATSAGDGSASYTIPARFALQLIRSPSTVQ